ncbi:MAG: twin-arginine translocase subunit TatB [Pseudomonadales bacterium]|nr:twin-arginine translocase subunit TatB [Pseudomonadales bacterium]MBO6597752.1 twin-arginine translocase subunit TatB [Pseudomonadales bacterium]MBO6655962.1 twin-arginine translocase subunit TatB [Pseudomonadales bacterium]MBO6704067.1 twin-arginine translocase subunit TatB [Pseudomonadales bacterium]MBO6823990.1 twin-arginine translocase subunit TatB [Pseudomonadales bacterium]
MFDIGFPELMMISIVALLVIGPEKLPETIRTISLWVGRLQRSFTNIRREIENEIGADEIRAQLHNESIMKDLEETKNAINEAHREVQKDVRETLEAAETEAKDIASLSNTKSNKETNKETKTETSSSGS